MKLLLSSAMLLMASAAYSQVEVNVSRYPVANGIVHAANGQQSGLKNQASGVSIKSENDSCFATEDGVVSSTFSMPGQYAALIKTSRNQFVTYSNLRNASVQKGQKISKGTFLGLINKDDKNYQLLYLLSDATGKTANEAQTIKYLQAAAK